MRRKYGNRKVEIDGFMFDSRLEAQRYVELTLMERAGEITDLRLQPEFILIPSFKKNGVTYRKTAYRADFSYFDTRAGKVVIEDTKGFKTQEYRLKKKLFEYQYPDLEIIEVRA